MDSFTKSMLGTAVGLQSASLVVKASKGLNRPLKTKDLIRNSTDIMVGTALTSTTASLI